MGCVYHSEYNAAKLAIMVAAPIIIGFAVAPPNFIAGQQLAGPGALVTRLNNFNGMYQAVNTFLTSNNFPHGIDMQDHQAVNKYITPIRMRRASPIWNTRAALLLQFIQFLRSMGAALWPGQGGAWF